MFIPTEECLFLVVGVVRTISVTDVVQLCVTESCGVLERTLHKVYLFDLHRAVQVSTSHQTLRNQLIS